MEHDTPASWAELDRFIEAFESALAREGRADFTAFLPTPGHDLYLPVLTELIRVDLEHCWKNGQRRRLEEYLACFPLLLGEDSALQELAIEEYRLRCQAGEKVSLAEYRQRFTRPDSAPG